MQGVHQGSEDPVAPRRAARCIVLSELSFFTINDLDFISFGKVVSLPAP